MRIESKGGKYCNFSKRLLISGSEFDEFFKIYILQFNYILRLTFYKSRLTGKQDGTPLGQPR